ncbi:MAG: hypothetical protein QOF83_4191 [Solirubrobacteraceae bacterium]|jgi:hypothetical protein|nr:hypothetical protein [Solirubrobacteraceae bacterium]
MRDTPNARSVKIGDDERTGWSSERPRPEGSRPRTVDISGRCRVLTPSYRMRYSPGSLVVIVGPAKLNPDTFADRVIEERGAPMSLAKVRKLLAGRVPESEIEERSRALLDAAVLKRLESSQTVVVPMEGLDREERERYTRMAHRLKRPRHLILLDGGRDDVSDEERPALDDLRRAVDGGEVGQEGFQTALRLSGNARAELKRIIFQPPPRDD